MLIVVGLGNPGRRYAGTRHNIGFMVVERLAASHGISIDRERGSFVWGQGIISGERVVVAKPKTFMNLSGNAVKDMLGFFGADSQRMLVIYDDCDLQPGRIRIKKRGGSGGHKGVSSIVENIGRSDFPRLRMGIGRSADTLEDYVLSPFRPDERELVTEGIKKGVSSVEAVITRGVDYAMNHYNR